MSEKIKMASPEMLSDDDPVLAEGACDPVLDGVLVNCSKVDVGPRTLLWVVVGCRWTRRTKTSLP